MNIDIDLIRYATSAALNATDGGDDTIINRMGRLKHLYRAKAKLEELGAFIDEAIEICESSIYESVRRLEEKKKDNKDD